VSTEHHRSASERGRSISAFDVVGAWRWELGDAGAGEVAGMSASRGWLGLSSAGGGGRLVEWCAGGSE